ncbi:gliding motility-associated C-terminal domain-containing protein [Kaistella sp. PBT33-4]|uniref:T9SS type B sorting domain-containing protein n=1 Tax=Kaistella sp. PBT33-4 TaxID=3032000 RepID=UPI0023D82C32|nr:T9SS type B sorting domain-containing protein [Kaistella sp. PBT33-4]MDF0720758.1 gliding motility-associated C-terminal domain-containing protein [Kaistella sp. PBT33-4]
MKKTLLLVIFLISQTFFSQEDCSTALTVCGNSSITYSPSGIGLVNEPLGGCLSTGEHNSIWYKITIATSGTLTFDLVPTDPAADYDWAIYGPNVACGNLGSPIRCNAATVIGVGASTGLNMTSTVISAAGGSTTPYCQYLNVTAGQTYYLYIDNWVGAGSTTTAPFSLTWGGTATMASPYNNPAISPNPFIAPGPNQDGIITLCTNPGVFDFSTLSAGIVNGNPNFTVTYHNNTNDLLTNSNPLGTVTVNTANTYYYALHYTDPTNPLNPINKCLEIGTVNFVQGAITVSDATVKACNNNNEGTAIFDLTSVSTAMFADPTATRVYYRTISDMNNGVNPITNPAAFFTAAPTAVYMHVTTAHGCTDYGTISLEFYPTVVMNDASLTTCFIETNPATGLFDLNSAAVGGGTVTKTYYPSYTDAANGTNAIANPSAFISPTTVVYVKGTSPNGCTGISEITLNVTPPNHSAVLKDKIICPEDTTTLDAGPGFSSYLWSTGATTPAISNISVGSYWVKLTLGECVTTQTVTVSPAPIPVVSAIDISNNTITVNVMGGTPPYQFSMDNVIWQDSNVFTNVPRGKNMIYVKDSFNCEPAVIEVTVPNLINAITPNNDGVNDAIDYSSLGYKKNLVIKIFDRYGINVYQADRSNGYKWDGRRNDRNISTGTYWYTVTWNEPDAAGTPVKYSGWILVKNVE